MKTVTIISILILASLLTSLSFNASAKEALSKRPNNASVYFIYPSDGSTVSSPVRVVFGLKNMGVAPAGIDRKNTGHHHLLIDKSKLPDLSQPLPATKTIKHFGAGQTETEIALSKGKHTLQLLLGNYAHVPHQKPILSKKITIYVK